MINITKTQVVLSIQPGLDPKILRSLHLSNISSSDKNLLAKLKNL